MFEYYDKHPERLMDDRGEDARRVSHEGLKAAFAIIDEYTLVKKEKP